MKTIKLSILLILFTLSAAAQAKVIQHYDENGNPTTCEIDSNGLEFIEGLCPGTMLPPWGTGAPTPSPKYPLPLPKQAYDDYGNPNGCWKEGLSPKVPFIYVGEVCPLNEIFFDKFTCSTATNDEFKVYLHHLRLTEVYVYGYDGVFFNTVANPVGNEIPLDVEVLNSEAKDLEVEKLEFLYLDHITNLDAPNFIQGTLKGGSTDFLTEISCIQNY